MLNTYYWTSRNVLSVLKEFSPAYNWVTVSWLTAAGVPDRNMATNRRATLLLSIKPV